MTNKHLEYRLNHGYIHNWLVAGPLATLIPSPDRIKDNESNFKLQVTRRSYREEATLSEPPIDRGTPEIDGEILTWNYMRCHEDHFVDLSNSFPTWQHLRTWTYTEIKSISAMPVTLVLTTRGPADIWLNGNHLYRQEYFSESPLSTRIQANLEQENTLLVRFEQVAVRECENIMAGGAAVKLVGRMGEHGVGLVRALISKVATIPGKVAYEFGRVIGHVSLFAARLVSRGIALAKDFIGNIFKFFGEAPAKFATWVGTFLGKVADFAVKLGTAAVDMGKKFVRKFIDALASLPGKVADAVAGAFRRLFPIKIGPVTISASGISFEMPSFAVGAWRLPGDMVAQVHKDEMIIPADIARRLRGEVGGLSIVMFRRTDMCQLPLCISSRSIPGSATYRCELIERSVELCLDSHPQPV